MARIISSPYDLDAARQIYLANRALPSRDDHWTLMTAAGISAAVSLDGGSVIVKAAGDPLSPGETRRLALALLEHADKAEKAGR